MDSALRPLFEDAAWIAVVSRFHGRLTIDSLAFDSPGKVHVHFISTSFADPRPSRFSTSVGSIELAAEAPGRWKITRRDVYSHADGVFPFSSPDITTDSTMRRVFALNREILRAHGVKLP